MLIIFLMRSFYLSIIAVIILTAGIAGRILAVDRYDILVNDDNGAADMSNPRVAAFGNGFFAVVWADKRNGQSDIYYQIFDSTGTACGSNRCLNNTAVDSSQFEPNIAANGSGQLAAVWKDYRNSPYPFRSDIFFSRIDTLTVSPEYNLTSELPDSACESPDVAVFSDGSAMVVWSDYRNRNWDIYGQRLGIDGKLQGKNFRLNDDVTVNQQHAPRIAAFTDGGFMVVWYDNRLGNDDIWGQRYNAVGQAAGINFKISDDAGSSRQAFPSAAADGMNRFFVCWVDWRNGLYPQNPDIYLRRYDSSGQAIGVSQRVSINDGGRAQKEPAIASDWTGNLCLVWSDSSSNQWDITAQIVDDRGILSGSPFKTHQVLTGKQLQPDIATDGYKFFCVWADSRAGHFDIYATIKQFNNPAIIARPNILNFTMEAGGALPVSQSAVLTNAGLGSIHWAVDDRLSWAALTPTSGQTPDTVTLSILDEALPYGSYSGIIRLVDLDHNDSSAMIRVNLNVTAPLLGIDPDTLNFRVFAAMGNPEPQKFLIENIGSGILNWIAAENCPWLEINQVDGNAPGELSVMIDINGLNYGEYLAPISIISAEAVNSPETAWVWLDLVGNLPYLAASPESLQLTGVWGEGLTGSVQIRNLGVGALNWRASSSDAWMNLSNQAGTDNDSLTVQINTPGLNPGQYRAELTVTDSAAFNQVLIIPVAIDVLAGDTVQFPNVNVLPGSVGAIPVVLKLNRPSRGGYIPFEVDSSMVTIDSIVFNSSGLPSYIDCRSAISGVGRAEIGLGIDSTQYPDSFLEAGDYIPAYIYFRADTILGPAAMDTSRSDSSGVYLLDRSGNKLVPCVLSGEIIIGNQTFINDGDAADRSGQPELSPNYPNPFNLATKFSLYLPRRERVRIGIYNLLGQEISQIQNGYLSAGRKAFVWDGRLGGGDSAPSGIYFYRVEVAGATLIRKMILIK